MLSVSNLDLFYGDAQALSGVSLEIKQKEIVAIVGANGAGKTSLIRTIAGIEQSRSGKVLFKGEAITNLGSHRICDLGIGQVAEGRQVFPTLSILENLQLGAMLPRARAGARRTLDEVFAMFPKLAERRAQLAGTLSGGEQQMLAIGRCLMGAPELIMFDEPSLGLAPLIVQEVLHTLRILNEPRPHHPAGGAERRRFAQIVQSRLRAGERPHRHERLGRRAAARRPRAPGLSRALSFKRPAAVPSG